MGERAGSGRERSGGADRSRTHKGTPCGWKVEGEAGGPPALRQVRQGGENNPLLSSISGGSCKRGRGHRQGALGLFRAEGVLAGVGDGGLVPVGGRNVVELAAPEGVVEALAEREGWCLFHASESSRAFAVPGFMRASRTEKTMTASEVIL